MSPVLEASSPKTSLTTSSYYNEWLSFLDEKPHPINYQEINLQDLSRFIVERPDGNWVLVNGETAGSGRPITRPESNIVDDIASPIMHPRRKIRIYVRVTSIKKGRPSICDEVET